MKRTILIADDNSVDRGILSNILQSDYEILEAENGEQVLSILKGKSLIISVMILDVMMPIMGGLETLQRMRSNERYLDIPVILVSTETGSEITKKSIEYGGNGFLSKPFDPFLVEKSVANLISIRENAALVNTLSKDALTGMLSTMLFFQECDKLIQEHEPGYYVMSCIDIDHFKVINNQYGMEMGDKIVQHVAECLSICYRELDGLASRFYADKFAVLYPVKYSNDPLVLNNHKEVTNPSCIGHPIRVRIGRCVIHDTTLKASTIFERAAVAEQSLKGRYDVYIAEYTESMLNAILSEQKIVNEMESALTEGQFIPFLQPQYNHATGALIGAEALVRWKKGDKFVSPGEFIPIFEKNGFVYQVDQYIWRQVSKLLRKWLDEGKNPLPVSVNISRFDLYKSDFFEVICRLAEEYRLPPDLLRLEVTESAFADSPEHIITMVNRLIDYGFTVEIDDFGSGYSSLNTLKDVPASILKLDMKFFSETSNSVRSGNIIESVVRMAKWLGMSVIAEGVEKVEQADFLRSIGCYFIQGYLYARPMPVEEYEKLLDTQQHEVKRKRLETVSTLDNNLFWDPKSMETLIFNSYVGGACIFEQYKGAVELLRSNEQYVRELGSIVAEGANVNDLNPFEYLDEDNASIMETTVKRAITSKQEETCDLVLHGLDGETERIHTTVRMIANTQDRYMFYCVIVNYTKYWESEQNEKRTSDTLKAIMDHSGNGIAVVINHKNDNEFVFANERYYEIIGYTKEEYHASIEKNVFKMVYPEDMDILYEVADRPRVENQEITVEFRIVRSDRRLVWVKVATTFTHIFGIEDPVQVVTFTDITDEKETNEDLSFLNDTAHDIMSQPNIEIAIQDTLKKLLEYYEADRIYMYETNLDKWIFRNTYGIFREGVWKKNESIELPDNELTRSWVDTLRKNEYVIVDTSKGLEQNSFLEEVHDRYGITMLILAPVLKGNQLIAVVGLDGPNMSQKHLGRMKALGDYFVVLLMRRNLNQRFEEETQAMHYLMEDTPGGFCRMHILDNGIPEIVYANRGFSTMLEVDYDVLKTRFGENALQFVHPDDMERFEEEGRKSKQLGTQMNMKYRHRMPSGEYMEMMFVGRFSTEQNGQVYLNAYYIDINEQAREEAKQKKLLDNLPCGASLFEYDGKSITIIHINRQYWKLVKREAVNYDRASINQSVYPDDIPIIEEEIESAIKQNRDVFCSIRIRYGEEGYRAFHVNGKMEQVSGSRYYIYLTYEPMSNEAMSYQDILTVALSTMMESSSELAYIKDKYQRYICCSQRGAEAIGLGNQREIVGKTDYDLFDRERADVITAMDGPIIESGEALINQIEKVPAVNGDVLVVNSSKYPIKDISGNVIGLYAISYDITSEKERESQLELLMSTVPGGLASFMYNKGEITPLLFNDAFYKTLGYSREQYLELTRDNPFALLYEEDLKKINVMVHDFIMEQVDGSTGSCVYRCDDVSGVCHWFELKSRLSKIAQDVLILNVVEMDITDEKEREEHLRVLEEEYRLAAQHSGRTIARYDIANHVLTINKESAERLLIPEAYYDVPYGRAKSGDISRDTVRAYIHFFENILHGKQEGNVMFQKLFVNGWRWLSAHSTTLFSEEGDPVAAIVSFIDVTEQYEKDAIYTKWQQSLENRPDSSYTLFRSILGEDTSFDTTEGRLIHFSYIKGKTMTFDSCTEAYAKVSVVSEEREEYIKTLKTDYLRTCFKEGKRRMTMEYREITEPGKSKWIKRTADLVERPNAEGIIVYLLFEDIDESKRAELDTLSMAETDALTGLLNRNAFENRLTSFIQERKEDELIAFFIMDIDGFKRVNDTFGHAAGDRLLKETGKILQSALWDTDLVGRLGGDEFIFSMIGVPDKEVIRKKVRRIWKLMHRKLDEVVDTSASIGITVCPDDGNSFEELYAMADKALYLIKENGKDNYGFYQEHYKKKE